MPKVYRLSTKPGSRRRFSGAAMTGKELRAMRIARGITLTTLAAEAGYNAVYISQLETGRYRITERASIILRAALARLGTVDVRTSRDSRSA